ncbi:MAG: F0F1 ATP synthase subunit A [Deltaproteobacteria bacterium]|jgi:F-type H+-transporting ATPase subunit a|nr:F0F1 ATP synthase subunit A [Deltaproteobacteria bacterium]
MAAANSGEMVLHLPTFLDFLAEKLGLDMHHAYFWDVELKYCVPLIMSFLVGCTLVLFSMYATRRMEKIPRGAQAFVELVVEGAYNFLHDMLGKHTARYLPFFCTLFFFILAMNLWGLIPLMESPTHYMNTTLSMAIVVFVMYNFEGLRIKKLGYFKHFFEPIFLAPLMFPLHVIGEFVRPASLSIRLYGNLTGEGLTLAVLVFLTPWIFGNIPVPLHLFMVLLALLFSTIQATIFTMLSSVYLSLAIEEHEEGH